MTYNNNYNNQIALKVENVFYNVNRLKLSNFCPLLLSLILIQNVYPVLSFIHGLNSHGEWPIVKVEKRAKVLGTVRNFLSRHFLINCCLFYKYIF